MAVEGVAASLSANVQPVASDPGAGQENVSELLRLEQDVRKMKTDYQDSAKKNGLSQSEIDLKIKQYDRLIAKIEQAIRQIKRSEARKAVGKKTAVREGSGSSQRRDQTALSIAALKASCRVLIQPSATAAQPDLPAEASAKNLDGRA